MTMNQGARRSVPVGLRVRAPVGRNARRAGRPCDHTARRLRTCRRDLPLRLVRRALAPLLLALAPMVTGEAHDDPPALRSLVEGLEASLDARIGMLVRDTGSDLRWAHRSEERFLMNSTVKALICGAVLDARDAGRLALDEAVPVGAGDLLAHSPMAETRVGGTATIAELCHAAVDLSDNAAANLLLERLGGPAAVTAFLRRSGDDVTRLDRYEPALNEWRAGDPRDTTTPRAILATLEGLLLGDTLAPASRTRLTAWMREGTYTAAFLRAAAPGDWVIADKSGAGAVTRTLIALVSPPGRDPWLVAVFVSEAEVDFAERNAAMASLTEAIVREIAGQ